MTTKSLEITQLKSSSKAKPNQRATLKALGLRGLGSKIYRSDLRAIRGMLNTVHHLIEAKQINQRVDSKVKPKKTRNSGIQIG